MMNNHQRHSEFKQESIEIYPHSKSFDTIHSAQLISLLSWNIIHKDFVDPNDFTYASPDELLWNNRLSKIKRKLSTSNADIVCLQEIDKHSFAEDIGTYFQQNHHYSFKINHQKKSKVDFSQAIMYKTSKFDCVYEDYRGRAMLLLLTNKLQQATCVKCIKSQNICIHHSFFVVTVHLDSPRKNKDNESTRVNQIKSVLKRINLCIKETLKLDINTEIPNIRVLIAGDFNSGHENAAAQMLLTNNNADFKHSYLFKDAYHEHVTNGEYECHRLPTNDCNLRIKYFPTYAAINNIFSIDLMFYSQNTLNVKGVCHTLPETVKHKANWDQIMRQRIEEWIANKRETNVNGQMHLADYREILLLPNKDFPSDHLPLAAVFEFGNSCDKNNEENKECRCCVKRIVPPMSSNGKRNKKNKSKKNRKKMKLLNTEWKFHQINSF